MDTENRYHEEGHTGLELTCLCDRISSSGKSSACAGACGRDLEVSEKSVLHTKRACCGADRETLDTKISIPSLRSSTMQRKLKVEFLMQGSPLCAPVYQALIKTLRKARTH